MNHWISWGDVIVEPRGKKSWHIPSIGHYMAFIVAIPARSPVVIVEETGNASPSRRSLQCRRSCGVIFHHRQRRWQGKKQKGKSREKPIPEDAGDVPRRTVQAQSFRTSSPVPVVVRKFVLRCVPVREWATARACGLRFFACSVD